MTDGKFERAGRRDAMVRLVAVLPLKRVVVKREVVEAVDLRFFAYVNVPEQEVISLAPSLLHKQFDVLVALLRTANADLVKRPVERILRKQRPEWNLLLVIQR